MPSRHSDAEPRRSSVDQPANAVAGRQNLSLTEDIKLFDTAKARAFGRNAIRSTKRHPFITMLTMASVVGLGGISWLAGPQTYQTMGVISARSGVVSSQIANPGRTINATSELPLANAKETVISEENIDQIIDQANLVNGLYDGETTLGRLRRNVFALTGSSPIDETAVRENLRIQLRTALTAQINGGSSGPDSLTISVYWPDAKGAAAIVQAAEDNFLANRRSAALGPIDDALTILLHYSAEADAEVDRLRTALDLPANDPRPIPESSPLRAALSQQADLSQRVRSAQIELDAAKAAFKYRYSVAQSPEVPTAPLSSPLKSYAMTIVLAMIAGIAAALLQDNRQRNRRSARQTDDSASPSQAESLAATPVDDGNDGDSDDAVPTPLVSALQPKLEPAFLPDSPPEDGAIPASEFDRDDTDQRQIAEFLGDDLARDHEFMDDEFELSEDTLDELTGADNLTHRNVAV